MNTQPRSVAQKAGCQQAEAFYLMLYRDTDGNEEWIWNSRDGVTPFIVQSRQGLEANHVEWQRDRFRPYHVPAVGDRIFVTTTPERARERAEAWYDTWSKYPEEGPAFLARWPDRTAAIEWKTAEILSWMGGESPDLIEVTEEVRKQFLNGPALVIVDGHQREEALKKLAQAQSEDTASHKLKLEQLKRDLAEENTRLARLAMSRMN